ncbi:hypothetical protein A3A93_05005 [Candidatus Roizmanbacteria bacterium RIFCSPLOWO2_01_FULL_38_12]|uniref:Lipid II isoglutaminyl synthase (glutamine-hydrolyzing) subunit GatD n=1 Tax=Candidatus Roizmanbacteria bacterium RIFCSPLOWO2_01_FULL_38_12 TaxID=1802061 RepID=A0A1F7J0P6_9BACT|nr:MAG: hypothetical protein A3F59_04565 [Candidatus Roizmanbacteria bacterium RIFCSPHIGHO2_12_FULL_38_13]OGK49191.1 MAG: hypothetical protein A3A93_05005 [Candidatus Roizmanbacteria bacterium RIFCSPLOWO2_01_FULL_38_12]
MTSKINLTIGWLYPDLMSTYGDRGNIIVLQKRCLWRGIDCKVRKILIEDDPRLVLESDLFMMGGAQDRQQQIVNRDLVGQKGEYLLKKLNDGIPGLFVCGAYQFLGKYYKAADGKIIKGLSFFDLHTVHRGENVDRCIGNISVQWKNHQLIGFENHGGRTYLADKSQFFAKVIKGYGNNGEDQTEGMIRKNAIGTYLHGPILPKNPEVADFLIEKALEMKYGKRFQSSQLEDKIELTAKKAMISRL